MRGLIANRDRIEIATLVVLSAIFIIPLAVYAYVGLFARYAVDDYCFTALTRTHSFLAFQRYFFLFQHGRYTATLAYWFFGVIGPISVQVMPSVVLTLQFGAIIFAIYSLIKPFQLRHRLLIACMLTALIIYARLRTSIAHDFAIPQTLYWQGGRVYGSLPLVLAAIFTGLFARLAYSTTAPSWRETVIYAGISFTASVVISGVYETFSTGLLGLTLSLQVIIWYAMEDSAHRRTLMIVLAAASAGFCLSLGIMATAPSTLSRQQVLTENLPFHLMLADLFTASIFTIALWFAESPVIVILLVILPALIPLIFGSDQTAHAIPIQLRRRVSRLIPPGAFGIVVMCLLPGIAAANEVPPARALTIPVLFLVVSAVWWAFILGIEIKQTVDQRWGSPRRQTATLIISTALVVLVIVVLLGEAVPLAKLIANTQHFAAEWDSMDLTVRQAKAEGIDDVEVNAFVTPWGLNDLKEDPDFWVNKCAADYYDVESISAR